MTLEQFREKWEENEDWAPGWDAIEEVFESIYKGQKPIHFGTLLPSRAMFGGKEYLDGYSMYQSPKGYKHLLTFGMSELYVEEEALGGEYSKWGYEMTVKLKEKEEKNCMWAVDMLSNLARYTFQNNAFFEKFQYISGDGTSICKDRKSKITALMTVLDTEISPIDTLYGRVEFIQLVGITERELKKIQENPENLKVLYERMKEENPDLVLDLDRTKSYL
ncbi:MAG TPA: suppressor of fused domain protein [Fusobacterium sp.]|uniref:suppressor of fused domain protein n=1 Tax=Fusobacterium sp. TaxID=68766 RepID=UPI002F3F9739